MRMTKRMTFGLAALILLPGHVWAGQDTNLICQGENPEWKLGIKGKIADIDFKHAVHFDVPQSASALNRDWPKAFTLIARTDTAIVIVDKDHCQLGGQSFDMSADVLTQDGAAAIVLTGCCRTGTE